jgi:hypothetical protein
MELIRHSDKTEFINRFNAGTKREFVGMRVDIADEPQAWKADVLTKGTLSPFPVGLARTSSTCLLVLRCSDCTTIAVGGFSTIVGSVLGRRLIGACWANA